MVAESGLTHISFVRVSDLLDPSSGVTEDNTTEEEYVNSVPSTRAKFLAHKVPGFDVESSIKADVGVLNTYRGYVKFLEDGFAANKSEAEISRTAKDMLKNGAVSNTLPSVVPRLTTNRQIFSDLVAAKFPHAVRISCHSYNNAGPKYALEMFPGAARGASPVFPFA